MQNNFDSFSLCLFTVCAPAPPPLPPLSFFFLRMETILCLFLEIPRQMYLLLLLLLFLSSSSSVVVVVFNIKQGNPVQIIVHCFYFSTAVDCGSIEAPINGSLSGNLTVFPNSIQFECDRGFILSGSSLRTCQANGTWDGLKTTCSGKFLCKVY